MRPTFLSGTKIVEETSMPCRDLSTVFTTPLVVGPCRETRVDNCLGKAAKSF